MDKYTKLIINCNKDAVYKIYTTYFVYSTRV